MISSFLRTNLSWGSSAFEGTGEKEDMRLAGTGTGSGEEAGLWSSGGSGEEVEDPIRVESICLSCKTVPSTLKKPQDSCYGDYTDQCFHFPFSDSSLLCFI